MILAGVLLGVVGVVMMAIGIAFLRYPDRIRGVFLHLLHLMYGQKLPHTIWKPIEGGVAFIVCGVGALAIGILKIVGVHIF